MSNITVTNVNGRDVDAGQAKAWVNFNGTGTVTQRDSLNHSSITDYGTGYYGVSFTNVFVDTNYSPQGTVNVDVIGNGNRVVSMPTKVASTTSHIRMDCYVAHTAASNDMEFVSTSMMGNLA